MSSVAIVRELMMQRPQVTGIVPKAQIYAGRAPQSVKLPSISLTEISGWEVDTVNRSGSTTMVRRRVQVTILSKNYEQMKALMLATKLGAGTNTGIIAGYATNSVISAGIGPEIPVEADGIYEQSRDFMVTFQEAN